MQTVEQQSAPDISSMGRKIRFLERRRDNLLGRIEEGRGTERSLAFDRNEVESLEAALDAMRYHWATVSRLDTPLTSLRELSEAVKAGDRPNIATALVKADEILADYHA
jgi:hypothetical protein